MTDETTAGATAPVYPCPKDGAAMEPMGRRGRRGAYRCPSCRAVFLDVEAMRRGRGRRPPVWAPVAMSVLMSIGMTVLVRWLRSLRAAPA